MENKRSSCSPWAGVWVSAGLGALWIAREIVDAGGLTMDALFTALSSILIWAAVLAGLIGIYNRLRRRT